MEQNDFHMVSPAIWLVFGGSYLNHDNAPHATPDKREQLLVDLLRSYLNSELSRPDAKQVYGHTLVDLADVNDLLEVWSHDLNSIYEIRRKKGDRESLVRKMAQRFLRRIQSFENCTVIPNGLVCTKHTHSIMKIIDGDHDNVHLAILKKRKNLIDWVQVNPGSAYHQGCPSPTSLKRNAFFEITEINVDDITEDWLYLLVGLKTIRPGESSYREVSLYECLLVHLNGKTEFQSNSDEGFITSSPISPVHTWQVVEHSFRYLLQHFLGDSYRVIYQRLLTGFKLSLMEKTFAAYQENETGEIHYLLQEMCRGIAQLTVDQGNEEQKVYGLKLIDEVKAAIEHHCSQQELEMREKCQLGGAHVSSLSFVAPFVIKHIPSSNDVKPSGLRVEPVLVKPNPEDDIIDYLERFKLSFMDELINSNHLNEIALLSYGIEVFLIDYLAKTDILKKSTCSPFSKDDFSLATVLIELAETYYSCQAQLVNNFLSNLTYQPHFYTKNVVIQFFVYAAVAALNYRDERIGPTLETHNLSVATSKTLSFIDIIPHLVVQDRAWLKVIFTLKAFFKAKEGKDNLFSFEKFQNSKFIFEIANDAEETDTDVMFAYQLLKTDEEAFLYFTHDYRDLDDEQFNRKWQELAYTDKYLPSIYGLLSKVAHFAKVSLTGFFSEEGNSAIKIGWSFNNSSHSHGWGTNRKCFWRSRVSFQMKDSGEVSTKPNQNRLTSYVLKASSDPYQRLIINKENIGKPYSHFIENEIISSQNEKPNTMDCTRYMQLGFLQSEPHLKLERLYIALKEKHLDFGCEEESILIKQTLFEVSILMKPPKRKVCSLLEWTVSRIPLLIHKLGLLCIEKVWVMQHRLTQHHAIGNILEVILALLTFYPSAHKDEFIEGITNIYYLLKKVLTKSARNLSSQTSLYLNAYLIISIQGKPQLLETEMPTVLKALMDIQNYKAEGVESDNLILLRVRTASIIWTPWFEHFLKQDPMLLNDLITNLIPQWDRAKLWQKSNAGLLFTCGEHAIKPLLGGIFFQNQPLIGLPDTITEHQVFKEYFGKERFNVFPYSQDFDNNKVPCYLSYGRRPMTRLTLIQDALLIEESINKYYQRYIPAQELLSHFEYPSFLKQSPRDLKTLRHWLDNNQRILIKDQERRIVYKWCLGSNVVFSSQHQGFVVPWDHLQGSAFKAWMERIELPSWIEIIAQRNSANFVEIQSLHFTRLGLQFDVKPDAVYCRQIHGYVLAYEQHINTLHGFLNYFIMEKEELNLTRRLTKVVIPHWQVTPSASLIAKTAIVNRTSVQSPTYFVYDFDPKTGLLKAYHTRGHLYLALLYYCSASLDNHDLSDCNPYHLARDNLEVCWKDQPFDEVELSIIDQFLSPAAMRDFHCNRIAVYLKVVSLLRSSLRLAFLHIDEAAQKNKEKSKNLLRKCGQNLPFLLSVYLENKSTIFKRVRLSLEEEEDVIKQCLSTPNILENLEEPEKSRITSQISIIEEYCRLNFGQSSQVDLSTAAKKSYKNHYSQLFSKKELQETYFLHDLEENISDFSFISVPEEVNFLSGFNGILFDLFRLNDFIPLYNLAKSSTVSILKYRYLLHHMVFRAKMNYDRFPPELVMMLARALLLVAESPDLFPESPDWFGVSETSVELSNRRLTKDTVFTAFPAFSWCPLETFNTLEEKETAMIKAEMDYNLENEQIWSNLAKYDLSKGGIPNELPNNPNNLILLYERYVCFSNPKKREIVRILYSKAAHNDAMYQFFVKVLQQCDIQKWDSVMGWSITPFVDNPLTETFTKEKPSPPISEQVSLEKWAIPPQPLIVLDPFFTSIPRLIDKKDFLFNAQLTKPDSKFQQQFYKELKDSWTLYHNETELSYSWRNAQSMSELERALQNKYRQVREQANLIWDHIAAQLRKRPNSESDNYFALRWYSGQVSHYHKGDILRLLVGPYELMSYNPNCVEKFNSIIQSLLNYVIYEIDATKIIRVLTFIEQYKHSESEAEQYSVLQDLVRSLQENLDPTSFRYPHWFLFQLENEIIVRENQRELIEAMLNQTEKAMYQLNMGEGKSSVILPLLSSNFTNGQQILRINVLSSLLITMKNFLRQRFSGLIRKRVYTLPFHRDTNISPKNLTLVFQALQTCIHSQHILLVTPEHRLCLQLKIRELMLENQQQIGATNIFNWQTYRQRVPLKIEVYKDLTETEMEELVASQDENLRTCLINEKYIDADDSILKVPPREQGHKEFARFREIINDPKFREWSCLKAAYQELLYNSRLAHVDSSVKLARLHEISALTVIDLLDESDEILRHGTELNYTIGDKFMFAGEELRWQIPQFFIRAIFCDPELRDIIAKGKAYGFTVLNENYSPRGGVPFIQLLYESYFEDCIKPVLIEKFLSENLPTLRKYLVETDTPLVEDEMSSVRHYIAGKLPFETEKKVMSFLADKDQLRNKLLIAKGWLSHGILYHVFNAKYRVQYGLNQHFQGHVTKPIAIPFMGKDTPSPRSEFSHPDVMLGFTIISYLYEGLTQQQLKDSLTRLKDKFSHKVVEDRLTEWVEAGQAWIDSQAGSSALLLESFEQMDLADEHCLKKLHQYLSGNHLAILFYLDEFILLQEAMQYLYKISANAHSLVGYDAALGFSGTDDRKLTMPFQVKSLCSETQAGTNGKLLSVLQQERNSHYYSLQVEDTKSLLEKLCLYVAQQSHCHALIDAGALVTGLTNLEVALFLRDNLPLKFQGILYFSDKENSLTVLTRDDKTIALQDCYLDKQDLFAYLDDIHTRGTDIKLPLNCHAILTVSMGMEKDKLMQAAMRLRHLAQKQSVSLWSTQAVTLAIARDNLISADMINSSEVIKWVTRNTINHINTDLLPVAVRKINFQFLKRAEAWLKEASMTLDSLIQHCQEKEMFSLEDFYGYTPQCQNLANWLSHMLAVRERAFWCEIKVEMQNKQLTDTALYEKIYKLSDEKKFKKDLDTIYDESKDYLGEGIMHSSLDNDQEKEIEVEVEITHEQEVLTDVEKRRARPENLWDGQLILRSDFIILAQLNQIIMPLKKVRNFVKMPANLKNIIWHEDLFMTENFINSIKAKPSETIDNYLRPVDAMLIHRRLNGKSRIILLSGCEAAQIKATCYQELNDKNLLTHLYDIDGPTQLPTDRSIQVSQQEQKLLTIIKLFAGECHYPSSVEVKRVAKRVGRLYPDYFTHLNVSINSACIGKLYGILIKEGYLDSSGIMTKKLLKILDEPKPRGLPFLEYMSEFQPHRQQIMKKLYQVYTKLIIQPSCSLKGNHNTLRQWVGTRGRLREYVGSAFESILNSECQLKCSSKNLLSIYRL